MFPTPAKTVYIGPEIRTRPNCRARLKRVLPHVDCADVRDLGPDTMAEVRAIGKRRHGKDDLVTLELLGWMDCDDLLAIFDREILDPQALAAAEAAREELADHHWGPFSEATHQEVYRFCIETVRELSPQTPVSVCHGTPATWKAIGGMMQMTSDAYICNCGPDSTPGGALYDRWNGPTP